MKTSTKIWLCIAGLLLIILGVVCMAKPDITLISAAWVLGCLTLFAGITKMVFTLRTQAAEMRVMSGLAMQTTPRIIRRRPAMQSQILVLVFIIVTK